MWQKKFLQMQTTSTIKIRNFCDELSGIQEMRTPKQSPSLRLGGIDPSFVGHFDPMLLDQLIEPRPVQAGYLA